jgi:hypothetical protein
MQGRRLILPVWLVAMGLGLGACSNAPTTPNAMTQQAADDIAVQAAGSLTASSGGLMLELDAGAGSVPTNGALRLHPGDPVVRTRRELIRNDTSFRLSPGGPTLHTSAASAETTFSVGSITYTVTRTFYDSGGNELPNYGSTATKLRITATANGSISTAYWDASVGRAGILDVTGIESSSDTLQFDGAGNDTLQCHFLSMDGTHERYFYALGGRSLEAVRALKDRNLNPYPLSGKARWAWAVDRLRSNNREDVEVHLTALVVVTFNGTANPEIVVDGTYHYHVNLNTGAITRV